MTYSRTRAEMETTITFDAEEKIAHIYTCDPVYLRKLDKLVESCPDTYRCVWTEPGDKAKKYTAPAKMIRFGKPASEAQKASAFNASKNTRFERRGTSVSDDADNEDE